MAVAYEETGRQKRALQAAWIPPEWRLKEIPPVTDVIDALDFIRKSDLLSPKELEITETTDANVLLESIASRKLSSVEVVTAFSKRAALAHQLTTCCTEMFFDEALQSAKALDKHLQETGKTIGPLHGLPVSIKDQFDVKGVDSSIGMNEPLWDPFW
jgi:amidase